MLPKRLRQALLASLVCLMAISLIGAPVAAQPAERVDVLIAFDAQPGAAEEALVRGAGGAVKHVYRLVPGIAASLPEGAIQGLLLNPNVVSIEPDIAVQAVDAELDNTWGVNRIGAGLVHSGNSGAGVKVAIIDSGIDYGHSDLDASYAGGYDFVNGDADPLDDNGHGTHVAGTVAAEDNDSGVVGVAPQAAVYALKVLDADGSGAYSDIIAALQWAVEQGIQVTNNSYGSSSDPGSLVRAAFDNSYALGVLHVAAAGNSGTRSGKGNNVIYPARYASVVAVAATDASDTRAYFSSTGDTVELAAPGAGIRSTIPGGGYADYNGTSMASPHVAGTAALVIASGITINTDIRQQLTATAEDLGSAGKDSWYGYGLVNAAAAAVPPSGVPAVSINGPADGAAFAEGEPIAFSGSATDLEDGDVSASLIWSSDLDGQIGAGAGFTVVLSAGRHTIAASATDGAGNVGSASINITVGTPSVPDGVSVASISYTAEGGKDGRKDLLVTVSLVDNLGNPVGGASVTIELYRNGTVYGSGTGTTGTNGRVTFKARNAPSGSYATTVTNVSAAGLAWDGATPPNSYTK